MKPSGFAYSVVSLSFLARSEAADSIRACEENNLRASMGVSLTLSPGSLLAGTLARCARLSFSLREKSLLIQAIHAPPPCGGFRALRALHLRFAQMIRTSFFCHLGAETGAHPVTSSDPAASLRVRGASILRNSL